jgi:hypothetical protein
MTIIQADDHLIPDDSSSATISHNNAGLQDIQDLLTAAGGGVVEFSPKAVYWVGGAENQPFSATPVGVYYNWNPTRPYLLDLVHLSEVHLRGNGAVLRNAGGKYGSFNTTTGAPRSPNTAPYLGSGAATPYFAMIRLSGVAGASITDLELDGNIAGTQIGSQFSDTGIQLQMSGIHTAGSTDYRIVGVRSHHHGCDGLMLNGAADAEGDSPDSAVIDQCRFNNNGRNNISIVGGRGLVISNTRITQAGKNANGVSSNPAAGIDFEAEGGHIVRDIMFDAVYIADNANLGIVADSGTPVNRVRIVNSTIIGTTNYSLWLARPGFEFDKCIILGTMVHLHPGYGVGADPFRPDSAVKFRRCLVTDDVSMSPTGALYFVNNLLIEGGLAYVEFERCALVHTRNVGGANGNFDQMIFTDCTIVAKAGSIDLYGRYRGTQTHFIEDGGFLGVPNSPLALVGRNDVGEAEDAWKYTTVSGGVRTTTVFPATVDSRTGTKVLRGSVAYNPPSIAAGGQATTTLVATGGSVGDFVDLSFGADLQGVRLTGYVSAADTVTAVFSNGTAAAVDLPSATLAVRGYKAA